MGPQGRIVVPADLRRELGLDEGSTMTATAQDGRLVLEPRSVVLERVRRRFSGVSSAIRLSDDLLGSPRRSSARGRRLSAQPAINVLDASAVLALLHEEPGADAVEAALDGAVMSCVNLSEVLQKAEQHGVDTEGLEFDLQALGVRLLPFDVGSAREAADLWPVSKPRSLPDGVR